MTYRREFGLVWFWTHAILFHCPHRHLAGEVAKEWQEIDEADKAQKDTLLTLVKEIVPYNMAHNAEHEACDLLMEIEQMDMLEEYIDDNAYAKVCLYLTRWGSCAFWVCGVQFIRVGKIEWGHWDQLFWWIPRSRFRHSWSVAIQTKFLCIIGSTVQLQKVFFPCHSDPLFFSFQIHEEGYSPLYLLKTICFRFLPILFF